MFHEFDFLLLAVLLVVLGHGKFVGSNEVESRIEVPHRRQKAVNCSSILEVAHKIDVQVLQRSLSLVDGVEVEHRLAGMLVCSVTRINYGNRRHFAGILGCALQIMTHNDDVGIIRHHHNRVFECLPLRAARHFRIGKANDFRAKTIRRSLKAETGASAWLEEQCGNNSSLEKATIGMLLELLCHTDKILYLLSCMVSYGYKASTLHCFHVFLCKDKKKFIVLSASRIVIFIILTF